MRPQPVTFKWLPVEVISADGDIIRTRAMVPLSRYGNVCSRQFGEPDGSEHTLAPLEARSMKSHNGFFAALHEGFTNLPENIASRWPTEEHMRSWLLIETGWFEEKDFECPDEQFAKRLATFIRTEHMYARITIHRNPWRVIVRRARSQALGAMGKADFEASKKDVLDLLESFVNVPRGALMKNAGKSA